MNFLGNMHVHIPLHANMSPIIISIIIKFNQPSAVPWMSRKSTAERFPALGKTEDTWRERVMIGVNFSLSEWI